MQYTPWGWWSWGNLGTSTVTAGGARYSASDWVIDRIAPCPWAATAGSNAPLDRAVPPRRRPLYTPEQRRRRDATPWTTVQGVLAPLQFAVFLISLALVLFYLATGSAYETATASVIAKTTILYAIMLTGAIWEKRVFGRYLFASSFFWEDVFSILVLFLHTAYLVELCMGWGTADGLMMLALAAYGSYAVNATQFLMKLRAARLEAPRADLAAGAAK